MGFRERITWLGRMALLLFVLASVAFLSAITTMRFVIQGREVATPDLIGKPYTQAQSLLRVKGLVLKIEDRIYSNQPVDAVVRQSPAAGTPLKLGEWVHVVLSLGTQKVTIPFLGDRSLRAAQIELLTEGLQAGEISSAYLPAFPADTVLQQDPAPGSTDATSPHVDILVSLGPRPLSYVMPGLSGMSLADAEARLAAARMNASTVMVPPIAGEAHGVVTAQLPAKGSRIEPGTSVELQATE